MRGRAKCNPSEIAFTRSTVTDTVARFKTTSSSTLFSKTLASTIAFIFAVNNESILSLNAILYCWKFLISKIILRLAYIMSIK